MNQAQFEALFNLRLRESDRVLNAKAKDYATSQNRLINFEVDGRRNGTSPERSLWNYRSKHETAMFLALDKSVDDVPLDKWREWIGDSMNYLILLEALLLERYGVDVDHLVRREVEETPWIQVFSGPRDRRKGDRRKK